MIRVKMRRNVSTGRLDRLVDQFAGNNILLIFSSSSSSSGGCVSCFPLWQVTLLLMICLTQEYLTRGTIDCLLVWHAQLTHQLLVPSIQRLHSLAQLKRYFTAVDLFFACFSSFFSWLGVEHAFSSAGSREKRREEKRDHCRWCTVFFFTACTLHCTQWLALLACLFACLPVLHWPSEPFHPFTTHTDSHNWVGKESIVLA